MMDEISNNLSEGSMEATSAAASSPGHTFQRGPAKATQHPDRASCAVGGDGSGRHRAPVHGAHFVVDHQLPRLPVPIETLCFEKHVGEAGDSAPGIWARAAGSARTSGVDTAAADGAATISSGAGTGNARKRLGHCVPPGGLVCVPRRRAANPTIGDTRGRPGKRDGTRNGRHVASRKRLCCM